MMKEKGLTQTDHPFLFYLYFITGEEDGNLRTRPNLSHPDQLQVNPHLAKKFRGLVGNTQSLHFDQDSTATVKAAFQGLMSDIICFRLGDRGRRGTKCNQHSPSSSPPPPQLSTSTKDEDTKLASLEEELFPRRRLAMILTAQSPSGIVKQGVMMAAAVQQLHVAYKTMGNAFRRKGQQVQRGFVVTVQSIGAFLHNAVMFTKQQCRKAVALLMISLMNSLYFFHGQLHAFANKKDLFTDAPASATLSTLSTSFCPSSSPVLSRISPAPTTACSDTLTTGSSPTRLSSSSPSFHQSTSPGVFQASPANKKAQVLSVPSNDRSAFDRNIQVALDKPEPSVLGGLFNKMLGGLLILSTGAIVGYFWSTDWRDSHLYTTSQEFIDPADMDAMDSIHVEMAIPISPEASRY
jgi:hypothetical protein